jgi:hypothetical protein
MQWVGVTMLAHQDGKHEGAECCSYSGGGCSLNVQAHNSYTQGLHACSKGDVSTAYLKAHLVYVLPQELKP